MPLDTKQNVIGLPGIGKSQIMLAGGKGANLGELSGISGINVPGGFCVTTTAYKKIIENNTALNILLDKLSFISPGERKKISAVSAKIREHIESLPIPDSLIREIRSFLSKFGKKEAFAIRSSATAEDLPMASFAGQQDTYLNIIGTAPILQYISKCWASLYTERAIVYRLQNGFNHRDIQLAVVVQQMINPHASGILFTADPETGNRKITSIDAGFGLGEALVSGLVNADNYTVTGGRITAKKISDKKLAVYPLKDGGTQTRQTNPEISNTQVLTDAQILQLESLGRKIESHFGSPQDIEWCLADDTFYFVQSRPVTTLFPIPKASDLENHLYLSVGHQQMMTDAMNPLGLSLWQLTAFKPMFEAGGRLFVDITQQLAAPTSRKMLIAAMGEHDPLIKNAIEAIIARADFIKEAPAENVDTHPVKHPIVKTAAEISGQIKNDETVVIDLIRQSEASIEILKQNIKTKSGTGLFDFIMEDIRQLRKSLVDPQNSGVFMAAINASSWINENMLNWLGEKNAADTLSQSVAHNITSEMGRDLLDVADVIRPWPEVIDFLRQVKEDNFLEELVKLTGGQQAHEAITGFLNRYGMRCAGEIDITRPRWREKPTALIPAILNNIKNAGPGAGIQRFEKGKEEALKKEKDLLDRLAQLPNGKQKAAEAKQMICLMRNFIGYREYPKYRIVSHLFIAKQALLKEAEKLVDAKVIFKKEDVYYLSFEEFREAVQTGKVDHHLIGKRKAAHRLNKKLSPPRVITSDGEIVTGKYNRYGLPQGAIAGLAVSSGIVEGRARVILDMEDADLGNDDILVTRFTDPSWTALFLSIKGLVTEVGGLMTHGAVIAREYGLPAVVGVEHATTIIKDGQRIRVNGTDGYIEILQVDV